MRGGTSISVGYMAENYVDLGFPGMLGGVFAVGLLVALVIRFFFSFDVPWMVRQGTALAFVYSICASGLEVSMPKILGSAFTFAVAYGLALKFAFPSVSDGSRPAPERPPTAKRPSAGSGASSAAAVLSSHKVRQRFQRWRATTRARACAAPSRLPAVSGGSVPRSNAAITEPWT